MTTDKTSTAPVMSLQQVRDALHEAHNSPGFEAALDSCVAAIDAHLNAPTPDVVGGDVKKALRFAAHVIELYDEATMRDDYMISSTEASEIVLALADSPYAAPRVQGEIIAWVTPEGDRSISASQKAQGERDGGASATSVRPFSVPAYAGGSRVQGDAVAVRDALETCERWFAAHMAVAPLIGGHGHAEHPMLTTIRSALAAQPKGDVSHPAEQTRGNGCPCEPSGSDGLACPGTDGRLLCDPKHKPEQTRGDVIGWMLRDDQGDTYFGDTCIWLDRSSAQEAADEMMDPDGDVYTPFPIVSGDVHDAPRQAVPDGEVILEHSGCGHGPQANQLNVRLYPGDRVLMVRGRVGKAMLAAAPSAGRMGVES